MMMDLQKIIDLMLETSRVERTHYHVTLGQMIEMLQKARAKTVVKFSDDTGPSRPHSYRGYYSDLAFESGSAITSEDFLSMLQSCLGKTFEGYKGGDFVMGEDTPLWKAEYSCCGEAIVSVMESGSEYILVTKQAD